MTKAIRVENADNSDYKLIVQVWDKGIDGAPDTLAKEEALDYPTSMITEYVHSSRYVVVKEKE